MSKPELSKDLFQKEMNERNGKWFEGYSKWHGFNKYYFPEIESMQLAIMKHGYE